MKRRKFLTLLSVSLASLSLLTKPGLLFARSVKAFKATSTEDVLAALFEGKDITPDEKVKFKVPSIAENGAVVPVTISTDMQKVSRFFLIVSENPTPLVATFDIPENTLPYASLRMKMGKTSNVIAVVEANGKLYSSEKEVKVTIGGCGG